MKCTTNVTGIFVFAQRLIGQNLILCVIGSFFVSSAEILSLFCCTIKDFVMKHAFDYNNNGQKDFHRKDCQVRISSFSISANWHM